MESCAGRVIVLARRLDGRLLLAPLGRRERLLEAAERRAETASRLWQSLGAEHDQRDGENQEQVCGAEDVFDHLWSLWFRASRPAAVHASGPLEQGVRSTAKCLAIGCGGWQRRGSCFSGPLVDALIPRPTNAAARATPDSRRF